jgi:hypothetical protein
MLINFKNFAFFLTIAFFSSEVFCFQIDSNSNETDFTEDYFITSTEFSAETTSETDSEEEYIDYEGENAYQKLQNCERETIFDRFIALHRENQDLKIVKHVRSINETLDLVDRLVKTAIYLFRPKVTEKDISQIIEMLFNIEIPMDCLLSLVRIGNAVKNEELWAFKCKPNKNLFFLI